MRDTTEVPAREEGNDESTVGTRLDFAEFFERTKQPMVRLAFLLTGSAAQAEDVVQDAFVQLMARWSRVDSPTDYMRRCVVNGCTSWHRKRAVAHRAQSKLATTGSYSDHPAELLDAVAKLPVRRRAVVVLRYFEQMDADEIGLALGISASTARSTLARALTQLKGLLE